MVATGLVAQESPNSLSEDELKGWEENGFVGPYTAWTPEEMAEFTPIILRNVARPSTVYGFYCIRDRHLDCATLYKVCTHPAIIERCASILGPDLVFWRSNFFRKPPGAGPIAWHRGTNFPGIRKMPAIDPMTNVTCWVALTDANKANGCVQLIPGSHKMTYNTRKDESAPTIFGRGKVIEGLDTDRAAFMQVKAGQFFLFNEKTIHGSDPNNSDTERTGVAARITANSTKVYSGQKIDGQGMPLKNWHAILVRGKDNLGHNKLGPPPDRDDYSFGPLKAILGKARYRWLHRKYGLTLKD